MQIALGEQVTEGLDKDIHLEGLEKDGGHSLLEQLRHCVLPGVASHEAATDLWMKLAQSFQRLVAVQTWHQYVQQDQVNSFPALPVQLHRLLAVRGRQHLKTAAAQNLADQRKYKRLIIDHQDRRFSRSLVLHRFPQCLGPSVWDGKVL